MDYRKPSDVVEAMLQSGSDKARLPVKDLIIRGILAGALLGIGTTLAFTASTQTGFPIVGALIFPACFVIVVLMGFELVTGSFALLPAAWFDRRLGAGKMMTNLAIVFLANLAGGILYAALFWISVTATGNIEGGALPAAIVKMAEAKTIGYAQFGFSGFFTAFVKGILCNWMVTMGVVMSLTSSSTLGKILAAWLPVFMFFAQGFEHAVVNMFLIPAGIMMGAELTVSDWWLWNQIPVTLGNIAGGMVFTGLALYLTHGKKRRPEEQLLTNAGVTRQSA